LTSSTDCTSADSESDVSGDEEPYITRMFFPLRVVPYPNGKREQRFDLEPARGEELIGGETEADKAKLQNFIEFAASLGAKVDLDSVTFGRLVHYRNPLGPN